MALIYDLVDPQELQGFVRAQVFPNLELLNTVLPSRAIDDLEYRFTQGDSFLQDVAQYRAFDAEAPLGTRPGLSRVSGELPPISKKMRLGEEQRLRLRQLQGATGNAAALVDQIFADAANLARSVASRLEMACGDALVNGKVTIAENGVAAVVDYGYTAGQKPTRATVWTDPAADIIGELTTWIEAYADRNGGVRPATILTSPAVRNAMLRNTAMRNYFGRGTNSPTVMTRSQLEQVTQDYDLPPVRLYDTRLPVGGVSTRVIPQDRVLLLPAQQVGATFSGTTAEAIELAGARAISNDQIAGMTAVVEKTFDPVSTWTKVSAIALPVLFAPEAVTVATVL
jgi:hypothetical protein